MKFLRSAPLGDDAPPQWTAVLFVAAGKADKAIAWIRGQAPGSATLPRGVAPRTVRFQLLSLPPFWERWLTAAPILQVDLAGYGLATLFVQGTTAQLARLAGQLNTDPSALHTRVSGTKPVESVPITPRQLEVLCHAVAMGYYDVPHRVDLRELGKSMDLSVSAVSQLLRRAQGQIIRAFIDADTLTRRQAQSEHEQEEVSLRVMQER